MQMVPHAASYWSEATMKAIVWPLARAVCSVHVCASVCLSVLGFECIFTCENLGQYSSTREEQQSQRSASPSEANTHVEEVNSIWIPDGTVRCGEDHRGLVHLRSTIRTLTLSSLCPRPNGRFPCLPSPQLKYPTLPADPSRHYLCCAASGGFPSSSH